MQESADYREVCKRLAAKWAAGRVRYSFTFVSKRPDADMVFKVCPAPNCS